MNKLLLLLPIILIGVIPSAFAEMTEIEMVSPFTTDDPNVTEIGKQTFLAKILDENGLQVDNLKSTSYKVQTTSPFENQHIFQGKRLHYNPISFNMDSRSGEYKVEVIGLDTNGNTLSKTFYFNIYDGEPLPEALDYLKFSQFNYAQSAGDEFTFAADYTLKYPNNPQDYKLCFDFRYNISTSPWYQCWQVGNNTDDYCDKSDIDCINFDNGLVTYTADPHTYYTLKQKGVDKDWQFIVTLMYQKDHWSTTPTMQYEQEKWHKSSIVNYFKLNWSTYFHKASFTDDDVTGKATFKYAANDVFITMYIQDNDKDTPIKPGTKFYVEINDEPVTNWIPFTAAEAACFLNTTIGYEGDPLDYASPDELKCYNDAYDGKDFGNLNFTTNKKGIASKISEKRDDNFHYITAGDEISLIAYDGSFLYHATFGEIIE